MARIMSFTGETLTLVCHAGEENGTSYQVYHVGQAERVYMTQICAEEAKQLS